MESSDASIIANVDVTSDTSNNMDKAEDSTSTSTASVPAVTEPEDWMSELQRLAAASVTWADWQLPDECDVSVPEDLLHRIDFKKPVSLIALQNELAEWEADIAKATAESENQSQPDPDDLVPLDELSEKMEKLVSELTVQRDRMKQQADFLRQLDTMSQDATCLSLADESVDRAYNLMQTLQLSNTVRREAHSEVSKKG